VAELIAGGPEARAVGDVANEVMSETGEGAIYIWAEGRRIASDNGVKDLRRRV
jgi:hypothetical protein